MKIYFDEEDEDTALSRLYSWEEILGMRGNLFRSSDESYDQIFITISDGVGGGQVVFAYPGMGHLSLADSGTWSQHRFVKLDPEKKFVLQNEEEK